MKIYNVIKGRVIDVNGQTKRKGQTAQLEDDRAKFYAHRIEEAKKSKKKVTSDLPEGFPQSGKFAKKGLNLEDFEGKDLDELQGIKGVGKSTAEDILAYFEEEAKSKS